jgi:hypothetical protein
MKKFLKPTRGKILIALVVFIVCCVLFIPVFVFDPNAWEKLSGNNMPYPKAYPSPEPLLMYIAPPYQTGQSDYDFIPTLLITSPLLYLFIPISYLVSCTFSTLTAKSKK